MLDFEQMVALPGAQTLRLVASLGPSLFYYSDFPPFRRLTAVEATLGVVLERGGE